MKRSARRKLSYDIALKFIIIFSHHTLILQRVSCIVLLDHLNQGNGFYAETKILAWSRKEKEIDDALLRAEKLEELTIAAWFSALGEESREEVRNVWESHD